MLQMNTDTKIEKFMKGGSLTRAAEAGLISPYHPVLVYEEVNKEFAFPIEYVHDGGDGTAIVILHEMMINVLSSDIITNPKL